jgi:acyl-CoA synthetase (AMP-forming)/AMP-acid ligase II
MSASILPTFPNAHASAYRGAGHWPQQSLGQLFAQTAARRSAAEAIIDGAERLSFRALDDRSRALAHGLAALGVGAGDVVAYQLPNWWETVAVCLASLRLGAIVNPLLPIFRASELRFTLAQSRARVLLIPGVFRGVDHRDLVDEIRPELPHLQHVIVVREPARTGMRAFDDIARPTRGNTLVGGPPSAIDPDGVALLMYTSGTTAEPKGVLHTHNSLAAEIHSLQRVHALTPADRTLMPSPLTHISGLIHGILTPALLGTSAVLMDRWDAARGLDLIDTEHVTYMVGAPTFLQDLLAQADSTAGPPKQLPSFRLFSCGGAAVAPDLLRRARQRFPNCIAKRVYGSTEFPTITTTEPADATAEGIETEGRPIWPAETRITDASGLDLPPGAEGEVQARGPECFVGYLDTTLNVEAFTSDGWFRTGDLGTVDARGYLRITGRLKEIVIRKGEKISIREIEDALAAHPAVVEVAVIAIPDPSSGEKACAVVHLRGDMTLDLAGVRRFLEASGLSKQKWPEDLRIVSSFPRTESGKIWRAKLQEALLAPRR